jgi:hypothetical protein
VLSYRWIEMCRMSGCAQEENVDGLSSGGGGLEAVPSPVVLAWPAPLPPVLRPEGLFGIVAAAFLFEEFDDNGEEVESNEGPFSLPSLLIPLGAAASDEGTKCPRINGTPSCEGWTCSR